MIPPEYRGNDPRTRDWSRAMAEHLELLQSQIEELNAGQTGHPPTPPADFPRSFDYSETTTTSAITLAATDLNMLHIVKNTDAPAIDFTLPAMEKGDWVKVLNDSGSSGDVVVKDEDANTIVTVTAGNSSGEITVDITGVEAPL